jgi:hypothetical protein
MALPQRSHAGSEMFEKKGNFMIDIDLIDARDLATDLETWFPDSDDLILKNPIRNDGPASTENKLYYTWL